MKYTFVSLFANLIDGYFQDSILKRSIDQELIEIEYLNPRDFTTSKHGKVDSPAIGGGAGMVMAAQPLFDTLKQIDSGAYIVFTAPSAKPFTQKDALRLSNKSHIVFVSGRYEGIDERVIEEFADELFSIGDYILTGGELPSLVMCDAISRNIDGVLGNSSSLDDESFENLLLEAPSFTKPAKFCNICAPSEFSKGNHSKIAHLKSALSKAKTSFYRPQELIKHNKRKLYEK